MNYPIKIFYSEEDKGYIATAPDLPGCSAWGKTEIEAIKEIHVAIKLWLDVAKKENRIIPKATLPLKDASGKILARLPKSLHKALHDKAEDEGVSLNQLVSYLLSKGLDRTSMIKSKC